MEVEWSLVPVIKKQWTQKGFCAQDPHRILLSFTGTLYLATLYLSQLANHLVMLLLSHFHPFHCSWPSLALISPHPLSTVSHPILFPGRPLHALFPIVAARICLRKVQWPCISWAQHLRLSTFPKSPDWRLSKNLTLYHPSCTCDHFLALRCWGLMLLPQSGMFFITSPIEILLISQVLANHHPRNAQINPVRNKHFCYSLLAIFLSCTMIILSLFTALGRLSAPSHALFIFRSLTAASNAETVETLLMTVGAL